MAAKPEIARNRNVQKLKISLELKLSDIAGEFATKAHRPLHRIRPLGRRST